MTRLIRNNKFARLALTVCFLGIGAPALAFELTVEVRGAKSEQGKILAAAYDSESSWLYPGKMLQGQSAPAAARATIVFRNLPAGRYAIAIFHDVNSNGALDRDASGIPSEPYAFSRDAVGQYGPPSFADSAIDLNADTTVTVNLH